MLMILMPMASQDYDPTEASIAWRELSQLGFRFQFASVDGRPASPDPRMMTGSGLGVWKSLLMARRDAVQACSAMMAAPGYANPLCYDELRGSDYDALLLHGGHAPGMRSYLESPILQELAAAFVEQGKPVAAICHGVLLLARSKSSDGRSVLYGRKCTTLLSSQELAAHALTRLWLGSYYRTYPETTCQAEVTANLQSASDFCPGPTPLLRDDPEHLQRGFTVRDGNLLTARWPGDAYNFARRFAELLSGN
ncbi:MAG: DJ-1/PfpI family protein [Leptospiraceae bacterium]|nr:DJ-1/PfpI family protein [Leptospiraceae bacterium]